MWISNVALAGKSWEIEENVIIDYGKIKLYVNCHKAFILPCLKLKEKNVDIIKHKIFQG
jgi:hypothetical protein